MLLYGANMINIRQDYFMYTTVPCWSMNSVMINIIIYLPI